MADLARVFRSVHNRADVAADRARGLLLRATWGPALACGGDLMAGPNARLQIYGRLRIGRHVKLASGCLLSVGPDAELEIGDHCYIGRNTVIVATASIRIGEQVDIAEHCTIRDSDHDLTIAGRTAGVASATPIVIDRGCWIAAGVRVLRGSHLGEGVVAAANAVVRGRFDAGTLIGGLPARVIRASAVQADTAASPTERTLRR